MIRWLIGRISGRQSRAAAANPRGGLPRWEKKWQARLATLEEQVPDLWQPGRIPTPIQEAVHGGWFHPGKTVLDLGCGYGEVSGWLAQQGYPALGVDIVPAVIAKAEELHAGLALKPTFAVADISQDMARFGNFDNVVDVGCFHGLDASLWPAYLAMLARQVNRDGRFLLLRSHRSEARSDETAELFAPHFDIVKVEDVAAMGRLAEADGPERPSRAFWMVRR